MKGITLCADCAYYSMKKHKCTRGATDEGEPTARFYADCPLDDVVPVVHGRWILQGFEDCMTRCSVCNVRAPRNNHGEMILSTFCWECGAKMDGGEENAAD